MARAVIFPGQGSQYVGMGKSLYDSFPVAKEVFQEVDNALEDNLSKIMFEGPEDDLKLTQNTQPALMTHSLAIVAVLKENGINISDIANYAAGHSLGEYSALAATEALKLDDTAKLLRLRGEAMQRAVPVGAHPALYRRTHRRSTWSFQYPLPGSAFRWLPGVHRADPVQRLSGPLHVARNSIFHSRICVHDHRWQE